MPKLNQIIAVVDGVKNRSKEKLTKAHHVLQKGELFAGHHKTYRPKNEDPASDGYEQLPPDIRHVTSNARHVVEQTVEALTELFDVELVREKTNCAAKADVVVDGKIVLADVPVTYLLFLDKQLTDLYTFVKKLPTLDPGERWTFDEGQAMWATAPAETSRTKKVSQVLMLAPATDKHPAQVKEISVDVLAGFWSTIKYSTAFSQADLNDMVVRVEKLQQAVKFAREQANAVEAVAKVEAGKQIFSYLFDLTR